MSRHVAALIRRLHPDTSVRQLERDAGLNPGAIGRYVKPSAKIEHVPDVTAILTLAKALDCPPDELVSAFAADVGLPLRAPHLTVDENEMLTLFRRLSTRDRLAMRLFAQSLLQASPPGL